MLVAFTCICCDLDFEDEILSIVNVDEITDDLLPDCPECMVSHDVIVSDHQPYDDDIEIEPDDFDRDRDFIYGDEDAEFEEE